MLRLIALVVVLACSGCTTVLGENFQGYVSQPVSCDPAQPQGASPRQFVACAADETCVLGQTADGGTDPQQASCWPIHDTLSLASSCTYANDCGAGAFCSTDLGCASYCAVGADCADGVPCLAFSPPSVIEGTALGFCATPCDPADTHACSGTCSFVTYTNTVCVLAGSGALGAACTSDTDCQHGLACDDVARHCTHYCRAGSTDCGSKTCVTAGEFPLSYGGGTYGYCSL